MSAIWLPTSKGMVDSAIWRLSEAAREYDARLSVGRNEETGDWCVYINQPHGQAPFPILGLGPHTSLLPTPAQLQEKLYRMDISRHGTKILDDMNAKNDALSKKLYDDPADEASGIAAEAFEWAHPRMTNEIKGKRVRMFVPRGVKPNAAE